MAYTFIYAPATILLMRPCESPVEGGSASRSRRLEKESIDRLLAPSEFLHLFR
jgi:hypothetical protein